MMLIAACEAEIVFDFQVKSDDKKSTMSSYNYLKETNLQTTGYSRGLKAGSFNFLEKGKINVKEHIKYNYGNATNKSESTYSHTMNVEFAGDRGISEFYGFAYLKNNRAIAAWKKIRYENLSRVTRYGENYPANKINVNASLNMHTLAATNPYIMDYEATIVKGAIETRDSSGWSNQSGARRIDWEHTSLSHGNVTVKNILKETGLPRAYGGEDDWLPCCYSGTIPEIEPIRPYSPWPVQIVKDTLRADTIVPQCNKGNGTGSCNQTCTPGSKNCNRINCTSQSCPGFDCIYTYNEGAAAAYGNTAYENTAFNRTTTGLYIEQKYEEDTSNHQILYNIAITNSGDVKIRQITVDDTLPANVKLIRLNYLDGKTIVPKNSTVSGSTFLTWSIDELNTGDTKTMQLMVSYTDEVGLDRNRVTASGSAQGNTIVYTSDLATLSINKGD